MITAQQAPAPLGRALDIICATLVQAHDDPWFRAQLATAPGLDTMPVRLHPEDRDHRYAYPEHSPVPEASDED